MNGMSSRLQGHKMKTDQSFGCLLISPVFVRNLILSFCVYFSFELWSLTKI
jgi:hypothetical protein